MAPIAVSFQVLPSGLADKAATYAAVDAAIAVVAASGLSYRVSSMETTLEGEYDAVMAVIKAAQEAVVQAGAARVFTLIKVDYDPLGSSIEEKLAKYGG
ncbi:thiamine-binding protein [Candidatus Chloroploca sp. M-50]|uniref:Thiamine-binding protein n=1 Tax=Candidatus Chloroploca mongolica TaxID=2528176 RepID=A0ABS4DFE1_9CHLR|nr:thiamine-binding protein [Candidatus Chloroploca mongolica]MBP1468169.1 thiamine-binding protein [Candidatus Chloroploca mongolica]